MAEASFFENHFLRAVKKITCLDKYGMFVVGSFAAFGLTNSGTQVLERENRRSIGALFPRFIIFDNSVGDYGQQNNEGTKVELRVHFFFFMKN